MSIMSVSLYALKHIEEKYILREKSSFGHVNTMKRSISAFKKSGPPSAEKKMTSGQEFGRFLVYFCSNSPLMKRRWLINGKLSVTMLLSCLLQ